MTAPTKMAKRAAAGTLALAVCFTGGLVAAGAASAASGFTFDQRISGADRTATSIAAAEALCGDGADTVIIVERDAVVDGLTASYAAGLNKAPILYVDRQGVPDQVAAEIKKLGATKAILVGGTAVLPQAVKTQLESSGLTVTRLSGPDRYATAAAVALSGSKTPDKVVVASGEVPADALAAGPVAYAKNYPLVLVRPDSVPPSTRSALDQLGSGERLAIGGTVRISGTVYDQLGDSKRRVSGANRQQTAIALANIATGELGFTKDSVALVSDADRSAVDALVASPVAGCNLAPLLFISGTSLGGDTTKYLQDHAADLTGDGYVFGGTNAVPQSAADEGTTAAGGDGTTTPNNQGFNITPNDAQTLVIATPDDTTDDRSYAVSGLDNDLQYNITLVRAENINIAADGKVTFKSSADSASASGFSADTGTVATTITVVNGSPINAANKAQAKPVSGNLSFTIDRVSSESVYPVVYVTGGAGRNADQGGPSARLETQATAAGAFAESAEKYGLGGLTTYVPVEADAGPAGNDTTPTNIDSVNKAASYFIAGGRTFFYDDNDQFRIRNAANTGDVPVTLATFVESLSTNDGLRASTYANDKSLQSTFVLDDSAPAAVRNVDAAAVDDTSVRITWTATTPTPDSYTIYRKAGTDESATLSQYTKVVTLPGSTSPTEYVDKGLTASTGYTYAVTQTVDGDESVLTSDGSGTDSVNATTTATAGSTTTPQSIAAGVSSETGFGGTVSTGDVYTIAFNRAINDPASSANSGTPAAIRLQDAGGESVDLTNDNNAATPTAGATTFRLNRTAVTYKGKRQPANTVLTITVGDTTLASTASGVSGVTDRDNNTANNNGAVEYPATITGQNGGITARVNSNDVAWVPSSSPDNVLETGGTAPTPSEAVAPTITTAARASATTVTLTMSEPVKGAEGDGSGDGSVAPGTFAYDSDGAGPNAAVAATRADLSNGGSTITLTFPGTVTIAQSGNTADLVTYTQAGTAGRAAAGDVVDLNDNRLADGSRVVSNNE